MKQDKIIEPTHSQSKNSKNPIKLDGITFGDTDLANVQKSKECLNKLTLLQLFIVCEHLELNYKTRSKKEPIDILLASDISNEQFEELRNVLKNHYLATPKQGTKRPAPASMPSIAPSPKKAKLGDTAPVPSKPPALSMEQASVEQLKTMFESDVIEIAPPVTSTSADATNLHLRMELEAAKATAANYQAQVQNQVEKLQRSKDITVTPMYQMLERKSTFFDQFFNVASKYTDDAFKEPTAVANSFKVDGEDVVVTSQQMGKLAGIGSITGVMRFLLQLANINMAEFVLSSKNAKDGANLRELPSGTVESIIQFAMIHATAAKKKKWWRQDSNLAKCPL